MSLEVLSLQWQGPQIVVVTRDGPRPGLQTNHL